MNKLKIMSIYAHPADPITDCGGTLALHAENGDEISTLILTHGARIHANYVVEEWRKDNPDEKIINASRQEIIDNKHKELERAADIIGISKIITLDYDDTRLSVNDEIIERVAEAIASVQPDILIMDYPFHTLPDEHSITTVIAHKALSRMGSYVRNFDSKSDFHIKGTLYTKLPATTGSAFALNGMRNDLFIDITSVVGKKIKAMDQFVSQGYQGDFTRKFLESHDGERGRAAGVNFAEAFCRPGSQTHALIPLSEYALKKDSLTTHRSYSTMSIREMFPKEKD